MKPLDTEEIALEDIAARPQVTGSGNMAADSGIGAAKQAKNSGMDNGIDAAIDLEPNRMEKAAGKVLASSVGKIREAFGQENDEDVKILLQEVLQGGFAAVRELTARPWVTFVIALGALGASMMPPVIKKWLARRQEEEPEDDGAS